MLTIHFPLRSFELCKTFEYHQSFHKRYLWKLIISNCKNKLIRNESNMHIKYYRLLPISFLNNWDLTSLIAASFICWQRVVVKSCRKKTISWLTHMIYSGKDVFQVNAQTRFYYEWLIYIIATAGKKFFDNLKS